MKHYFSIILGLSLLVNSSIAQINNSEVDSYLELESLGKEQFNGFYHASNQAALAKLKIISATFFSERKYLLDELNLYRVSVAVPTVYGNIALKMSYAGSALYNQIEVGVAYARSLGTKVDLGIQFNYEAIVISQYASRSSVTAEIAAITHLTDKLQAGIHIANPKTGNSRKNRSEKIPSLYSVGMGYDASDKFFLAAEVKKEEYKPIEIIVSFRYLLLPFLSLRAGVNSSIASLWYGVGLAWKNIKLDLTTAYHPQLGITPGILIAFFGQEEVR